MAALFRRSTSNSPLVSLFIFMAIGAFGVGMYYYTEMRPHRRQKESASWTTCPCQIRVADVESHTSRRRSSTGHRRRTRTSYSPHVVFEYSVNGQSYTSEQFWFGTTNFSDRTKVEKIVEPFAAGSQATCFVNPADPTDAVLTRDLFDKGSYGWVAPAIMACVGIVGTGVSGVRMVI